MSVFAKRSNRRGFTLVELLVVVLVIGALLAIALPLYQNSVKNANMGVAKANLRSMFNATQAIRVKTGAMPADATAITAELGATMDQHPTGVTYTFSDTAGSCVLTATDGTSGHTVLGVSGESYSWTDGQSAGAFADVP